ncbi:MAG: Uma2 family endonuclease [Acidobacteriaceae bacterium]|nr:Uma2 family endonuclease [Acidobacteriaceae bacterium]
MIQRQIVLNDSEAQLPLRLRTECCLNDDEYFEFCAANDGLRIERTSNGEIIIMPPTEGETGARNADLTMQLGAWAKRDNSGKAFASCTEFILPDRSGLSPDGSWIENSRLQRLSRDQKRKFPPLCPDFVIELTSPSDRLPEVREKMQRWMANGVQLGWLIDPDERTVYIYRPNREPEQVTDSDTIQGEGPVAGFVLELRDIFAEL